MLKHLLLSPTLAFVLVSASTSTLACSKQKYDQTLWVITDSGTITDNSFNESTYQGANEYIHNTLGLKDTNASYIRPENPSRDQLVIAYKSAILDGAEKLLLPGFLHIPYLPLINNLKTNNKQPVHAVIVDGPFSPKGNDSDFIFANQHLQNIIDLSYSSEASGLYAGVIAGAFASTLPKNKRTVGMFGGIDNFNTVDNYMAGFMTGISLWDYVISPTGQQDPKAASLFKLFTAVVHDINKNTKPAPINWNKKQASLDENSGKFNKIIDNVPVGSPDWFSGSFIPGGGKYISQSLVSSGANIIFPVAGVQLNDCYNLISKYQNSYIFGVDSDASKVYKTHILASALKKVKTSVAEALNNTRDKIWPWGKVYSSGSKENRAWNGLAAAAVNNQAITTLTSSDAINDLIYGSPTVSGIIKMFNKINQDKPGSAYLNDFFKFVNQNAQGNIGKYLLNYHVKNNG